MPKLIGMFKDSAPCLVVSLIENSLDAAKAARDGGADGLKTHNNMFHAPSGIRTYGWKEERDKIARIVADVKLPTGIMPRTTPGTTVDDVEEFRKIGLEFVDLLSANASPQLLSVRDFTKWMTFGPNWPLAWVEALVSTPGVDVCELGCLPPMVYGSPFSVEDLCFLTAVKKVAGATPVLLPMDRRYDSKEMGFLCELGFKNIMLGVMVTGTVPADIERKTREFRRALDSAKGR